MANVFVCSGNVVRQHVFGYVDEAAEIQTLSGPPVYAHSAPHSFLL